MKQLLIFILPLLVSCSKELEPLAFKNVAIHYNTCERPAIVFTSENGQVYTATSDTVISMQSNKLYEIKLQVTVRNCSTQNIYIPETGIWLMGLTGEKIATEQTLADDYNVNEDTK